MIVDFLPSHLFEIDLQPAQRDMVPWLGNIGQLYASAGPAKSVIADDGRVIVCCGLLPLTTPGSGMDPWCAVAWTFLAVMRPGEFATAHRAVASLLADHAHLFKRIEAHVDQDFEPGHRWMKALGFCCEAERMSCAGMGGESDMSLYAKVAG